MWKDGLKFWIRELSCQAEFERGIMFLSMFWGKTYAE